MSRAACRQNSPSHSHQPYLSPVSMISAASTPAFLSDAAVLDYTQRRRRFGVNSRGLI